MTLRDAIRDFEVVDGSGSARPLVLSEQVLIPTTRMDEVAVPPRWGMLYLFLGLGIGGILLVLGRGLRATGPKGAPSALSRGAFGVLAFGWSLLSGVGGLLLVLVLFTDHHFMYWNESILQFNPLSLAVAALLVPASVLGRASGLLVWLAWGVVAISVVGVLVRVLPLTPQDNTIFLLLSLPVHVGLALGLTQALQGRTGG